MMRAYRVLVDVVTHANGDDGHPHYLKEAILEGVPYSDSDFEVMNVTIFPAVVETVVVPCQGAEPLSTDEPEDED